MKIFRRLLLSLFLAVLIAGCGESPALSPEKRPAAWAQPVAGATLGNFHKVSDELYRSEYPSKDDIAGIKSQNIRTIINLRSANDRSEIFAAEGLKTHWHKSEAGSITRADLVAVLKLFRDSPKPALVHCWHGSDRTGFIVAGYRLVFQNWSKEDAIREMREGGFGFHETWYKNIIAELESLDVEAVKKEIGI